VTVRLRGRERIYAHTVKDRLIILQQQMEDVGKAQYRIPKQE
jgi:translation initiation factor IF-3